MKNWINYVDPCRGPYPKTQAACQRLVFYFHALTLFLMKNWINYVDPCRGPYPKTQAACQRLVF